MYKKAPLDGELTVDSSWTISSTNCITAQGTNSLAIVISMPGLEYFLQTALFSSLSVLVLNTLDKGVQYYTTITRYVQVYIPSEPELK